MVTADGAEFLSAGQSVGARKGELSALPFASLSDRNLTALESRPPS